MLINVRRVLGRFSFSIFTIFYFFFLYELSFAERRKPREDRRPQGNYGHSSSQAEEARHIEGNRRESRSELERLIRNQIGLDPNTFNLTFQLKMELKALVNMTGLNPADLLQRFFFSASIPYLSKLFRVTADTRTPNARITGPAGIGKTFLIKQIAAMLFAPDPSYLPSELKHALEISSHDVFFGEHDQPLQKVKKHFFGENNIRVFELTTDLLSNSTKDSSRPSQKADDRIKENLIRLFRAAEKDFEETRLRTIFTMDEAATHYDFVFQTLKQFLDRNGFQDPENPFTAHRDPGYNLFLFTTDTEYHSSVSKGEGAIDRRFTDVTIYPYTAEQVFGILQEAATQQYESLYSRKINEEVLWGIIHHAPLMSPVRDVASPALELKLLSQLFTAPTPAGENYRYIETSTLNAFIANNILVTSHWFDQKEKLAFSDLSRDLTQRLPGFEPQISQLVKALQYWKRSHYGEYPPVFAFTGDQAWQTFFIEQVSNALFGFYDQKFTFSLQERNGHDSKIANHFEEPKSDDALPPGLERMQKQFRARALILEDTDQASSPDVEKLEAILQRGEFPLRKTQDNRTRYWVYPIFLLSKGDKDTLPPSIQAIAHKQGEVLHFNVPQTAEAIDFYFQHFLNQISHATFKRNIFKVDSVAFEQLRLEFQQTRQNPASIQSLLRYFIEEPLNEMLNEHHLRSNSVNAVHIGSEPGQQDLVFTVTLRDERKYRAAFRWEELKMRATSCSIILQNKHSAKRPS